MSVDKPFFYFRHLPADLIKESTSYLSRQELLALMPQGSQWRTLAQGDRRWLRLRSAHEQGRVDTAYQQGREAAPRVYLVSKVGVAALSAGALVQLAGASAPLVFRATALITFGSHNLAQWRTRYYHVLLSGVVMGIGYNCYQENMLLQSAALVSQSALFMVRTLHLEPRVEQFCGEAYGRARQLATRVSIRVEKASHTRCGRCTLRVVRRIFAPIQPVVSRVASILPSISDISNFFHSKELSIPGGF